MNTQRTEKEARKILVSEARNRLGKAKVAFLIRSQKKGPGWDELRSYDLKTLQEEIKAAKTALIEAKTAKPISVSLDKDVQGNSYSQMRVGAYLKAGSMYSPLFGTWGM